MRKILLFTGAVSLYAVMLPCFSAQNPSLTTEEALSLVKHTVEAEKLVDKPKCVDYFYSGKDSANIDIIEIVEKHDSDCGGDPGVAPRLFSVYVDLQTHQMASDKDDPVEGTLSMLPAPQ